MRFEARDVQVAVGVLGTDGAQFMMSITGEGVCTCVYVCVRVCMCAYVHAHCSGGSFYLISMIIEFLK